MKRIAFSLAASIALILVSSYFMPKAFSQTAAASSVISGTVRGSDGGPMEGVAVSARANDKSFTTTVYTDHNGEFYFPRLETGQYKVWAQAVGFVADKKEFELQGDKRLELTLKKLEDFHSQLSATELLASLPGNNPNDRRMKRLLIDNCDSCHTMGWVLQNRFDSKGWATIINLMGSRIDIYGALGPEHPLDPILVAYKDQLVQYLAHVRGPDAPPLSPEGVLPRPTGETTQVVVTEFDLPAPDGADSLARHNGSDWSDGTPSKHLARGAHDIAMDGQGNIWGTDDFVPDRSVYKLDPRTGKVSVFSLPGGKNGSAVSTHGIATDLEGNVWFTADPNGIVKADVKTDHFQVFTKPDSLPKVVGFVAVDSKDNVWFPHTDGAYKVDQTGKYTSYDVLAPGNDVYGMTVDSEDNAWFAQPGGDRVVRVDGRTGKVSEVRLPPYDPEVGGIEVTPQDREIYSTMQASTHNSSPFQEIPRRPGADPKGDFVYVPEYAVDTLAKIDIHSFKISEYRLPHPYSQPYAVAVDKNHMVWINLKNGDRIAKFNPITAKFTEYFLPTRGTETRDIIVDNTTDPPTVWTPYNRTNKIARIQFRTGSGAGLVRRPDVSAKGGQ